MTQFPLAQIKLISTFLSSISLPSPQQNQVVHFLKEMTFYLLRLLITLTLYVMTLKKVFDELE